MTKISLGKIIKREFLKGENLTLSDLYDIIS